MGIETRYAYLRPDSDVDIHQGRNTGDYNYECVDDPIDTPDDDATYCYDDDNNTQWYDIYGGSSWEGDILPESLISIKVEVFFRGKKGNAWVGQIKPGISVEGTTYWGSYVAVTTSYANYSGSWVTNPATGNPWTYHEVTEHIDGMGTFLNPGLAQTTVRCTQVYIKVTYTCKVGYTCVCNATCYQEIPCTCDNTCYGQGVCKIDYSCGCFNLCYGEASCTCDNSRYQADAWSYIV